MMGAHRPRDPFWTRFPFGFTWILLLSADFMPAGDGAGRASAPLQKMTGKIRKSKEAIIPISRTCRDWQFGRRVSQPARN
jgi:hypothetical protein